MTNLPKAIICDLDGTLCLFKHHRGPYDASTCINDTVNHPVRLIIESLNKTHDILFVSGRESKYQPQTVEWIDKHVRLKNWALFMRATDDNRKDSIVKQEIYDAKIKDIYQIDFVLDDRDQVVTMWRANGLTCLQVAEGNF